ncbi:MAG: hypothetical protein WCD79_17680 [Chthoniobacteraceae bacterium]
MKFLPRSLGSFVAGVLLSATVAAGEEPQVESGKETLHVFGGQPAKVELSIDAPIGSKAELRASLFQVAATLAAPLQKNIPLGDEISFAAQTHKRVTISLPIPVVKRRTQIVAAIEVKGAGDWHAAGHVDLMVYPRDALKSELLDVAGATRLEVFGDDKRLGLFLKNQEVKTDDIGSDLPDRPKAGHLYVGTAKSAELSQWLTAHSMWEGNLVVFCGDSELLPGAFVEIRGRGHLAKVTLPLLDTLAADPPSQKTFVAILAAILNHQTP